MTSETKCYILYSEIEVREKPMDCGYFVNGDCVVPPFGAQGYYYKPTEEEQKALCKNEFRACPRFTAYQNHLKAVGIQKN